MFGSRFHQRIGSLVFPDCCAFCKQQIFPPEFESATREPTHCCNSCYQRLTGQQLGRCHKCGASALATNPFGDECQLCHGLDLRFERCVAIGDYRGLLQQVIVQMKRTHDEITAIGLGRLLAGQIERYEVGTDCHLVVPVPTHWIRRFKRGFHAATIIADGVCQAYSIPANNDIVFCSRQTKKQGTLMNTGRFANVKGAFSIKSKAKITDKRILLVDDVMTSGATASEIAKVLLRAGAASVVVAVAARGARVS